MSSLDKKSPFDYLNCIYAGEKLADDSLGGYSQIFIDRFLSFDPAMIKVANRLNTWHFSRYQHYHILAALLKGNRRYVKYQKKVKVEPDHVREKLFERCDEFLHWTRREFDVMMLHTDPNSPEFIDMCQKFGMTTEEIEHLRGIKKMGKIHEYKIKKLPKAKSPKAKTANQKVVSVKHAPKSKALL
jgi:hypothetical protein